MSCQVLSPAESGEFIARHAKHVTVHEEGLYLLTQEILKAIKAGKLQIPETDADAIHPSPDHPRAADWVFVTDALNFCFWSYTGKEKWTVDGHSGYYALEAALSRAIKEGKDITDPNYYSKLTKDELSYILRSDNNTQIPLLDKRVLILQEVGQILIEKYNGTFETCVKDANKSASKLLEIVVENFPSFRDEAVYAERSVSLYKRAQILVADLWNFFGGKGWGEFYDVDVLTMFADYRVPQVLVCFGALSYSQELMEKLKKEELLPPGSEEEVEIRGCSIHAVELLKKRIHSELSKSTEEVQVPNSSLLDYYLWCYRRKHADRLESIPFHRTLGIYY